MQQLSRNRPGIRLRDVLPEARMIRDHDLHITSCCDDSRLCREGDLFVAITGPTADGHEYAHEAVSRGAQAVLAERPLGLGVPVCLVDDSRDAYGRLCQALAHRPSDRLNVIGVTGTNGKTVTSLLISSILTVAEQHVGYATSIDCCDGAGHAAPTDAHMTQPELANLLSRMAANGCGHAVMEISSRELAQRRTAGIGFDAAILTNVRRDHLDYHGSVVNYRRAKERLLESLKPSGFAVINADDAASQRVLSTASRPVITVAMRAQAEVTGYVLERYKSEQTFLLTAGQETVPVRTGMIGDHHVYNCLAAAATCLVMGVDLLTIARGLERMEAVPGRLERIECGQPFGVFVDSAQSPDTMAVGLRALKQVTAGRLICVFGLDSSGDPQYRPLVGRVVEKGAELSVITSNNPRHESPLQIAHDILDGYDQPGRPHVIPNREKAIVWALTQARPGDTVLVAGRGCQSIQQVGFKHVELDDRQVVRRWLYDVAPRMDYATPATYSLQ